MSESKPSDGREFNENPPLAIPPGGRKLPDGTAITPEGLHVSRSGAVMGRPEAEHSQYGLVRDDDSKAGGLTEKQIRGVEGDPEETSTPPPA